MLKLFKKNGLYGIEENGDDNVPFVYENKEDAIDEWKYFEIINFFGTWTENLIVGFPSVLI